MTTTVTKESLAARIVELESSPRSLKEDYTLAAYKMLLATMEAEPVYQVEGTVEEDENGQVTKLEWVDVPYSVAVMACDEFGLLTRVLYKSPPPAQPEPVAWIPVSERMPEDKPGCYEYLVFETLNNRVAHDYWNVPDDGEFTPFWNHYGEYVTHWMPLPADPVK